MYYYSTRINYRQVFSYTVFFIGSVWQPYTAFKRFLLLICLYYDKFTKESDLSLVRNNPECVTEAFRYPLVIPRDYM